MYPIVGINTIDILIDPLMCSRQCDGRRSNLICAGVGRSFDGGGNPEPPTGTNVNHWATLLLPPMHTMDSAFFFSVFLWWSLFLCLCRHQSRIADELNKMAAGGLLSLYAANHRLSNTHTAWETRSKFNQRRRKVRQHCSSAPRWRGECRRALERPCIPLLDSWKQSFIKWCFVWDCRGGTSWLRTAQKAMWGQGFTGVIGHKLPGFLWPARQWMDEWGGSIKLISLQVSYSDCFFLPQRMSLQRKACRYMIPNIYKCIDYEWI